MGKSKQEHGPGIAELIQLCDRREKKVDNLKATKTLFNTQKRVKSDKKKSELTFDQQTTVSFFGFFGKRIKYLNYHHWM